MVAKISFLFYYKDDKTLFENREKNVRVLMKGYQWRWLMKHHHESTLWSFMLGWRPKDFALFDKFYYFILCSWWRIDQWSTFWVSICCTLIWQKSALVFVGVSSASLCSNRVLSTLSIKLIYWNGSQLFFVIVS